MKAAGTGLPNAVTLHPAYLAKKLASPLPTKDLTALSMYPTSAISVY